MSNQLSILELRKMAVEVQCINLSKRPAAASFRAKLNALVSRAPKIRWWA